MMERAAGKSNLHAGKKTIPYCQTTYAAERAGSRTSKWVAEQTGPGRQKDLKRGESVGEQGH